MRTERIASRKFLYRAARGESFRANQRRSPDPDDGNRSLGYNVRRSSARSDQISGHVDRFGVFTSFLGQTWPGVLELWQHLESTGWDIACLPDHFMPNTRQGE